MKRFFSCVISILLTFVMIAAIVPLGAFTAAADDKITVTSSGATINKAYLPRVGEPVISSSDFISVSKGDVYEKTTERGTWYSDELTGKDVDRISVSNKNITYHEEEIGYTFEAGRTYYYSFDLKIKSNFKSSYVFANNKNAVSFTARNLDESEYTVFYTWGRGEVLEVVLKFTMPGEREYNDIETAYAYKYRSVYGYSEPLPPVQGKPKPVIYSNFNNYDLEVSWDGEFVNDPHNAKSSKIYFAVGDYKLTLTFTAKTGYKFAPDCQFKMVKSYGLGNDPEITAVPDSATLKDGRQKFVVVYSFHVEDFKPIEVIKLGNKCSTKTDFYPRSNQALTDCRQVGFDLDDDLPYQRYYTNLAFSTYYWYNDKDELINYAPRNGMVKYNIYLEMKDNYKDIYRFDYNPTVEIEGLDPDCYWAKCEFKTGIRTQIFITLYFVSDYHLKSKKTGSTYDNRMEVHSYESLKLAVEEPNIRYIELNGIGDTLPFREYETANQKDNIKRDSALVIKTDKFISLYGDNSLKIEQANPDAYYPYTDLFRIERGAAVTVSGEGSLNVQFGQPNYPAAIFFNKGTLTVEDGVSLYAEGIYKNVYPQAINNSVGKLTINGGSFNCKNCMEVEDAAVILGYSSDTYIDGGTFDATYGTGGISTNYGLMTISDYLTLEINRGTFKSCGGIHFNSNSARLSDYCTNLLHTCTSGGYVREPYQITNSFLSANGGTTQVFELIDKFYANVSIPVAGSTPRDRVAPATDKYKLRANPTWYCNGAAMGLDTAFEVGKQYSVKFELQTVSGEGYRMYGDIDGITAFVNNKAATVSKSNYSNTVTVEFNFGDCKDCVYSVNVINIDYPEETLTPDMSAAVDGDYANVDNKNIKWYKNERNAPGIEWVEMSAYEKFVSDDYSYKVEIPVKLKSKYDFNLSPYDGTPLIDAAINGERCDYEPYYNNGVLDNKWVVLYYIYPFLNDTVIESIDIRITAPVDGEYPTYQADIWSGQFSQKYGSFGAYDIAIVNDESGKLYYGHNMMTWYDVTAGRYIYDDETFINGHEYRVSVRVYSYPDYSFYWNKYDGTFVTATVNGEEATLFGTCDQWEHGVTTTFVCKGNAPEYSVSGTVTSGGNSGDDITLQLIKQGMSDPAFETVVNGLQADYYFANVPAGTYTLKVSKPGHSTAQYSVTVINSSVTKDVVLSYGNVLIGDVNGDGIVNDQDAIYLLFYTFFPSDYPINQTADFNSDGKTDDQDAVYLLFYTFFPSDYPI